MIAELVNLRDALIFLAVVFVGVSSICALGMYLLNESSAKAQRLKDLKELYKGLIQVNIPGVGKLWVDPTKPMQITQLPRLFFGEEVYIKYNLEIPKPTIYPNLFLAGATPKTIGIPTKLGIPMIQATKKGGEFNFDNPRFFFSKS